MTPADDLVARYRYGANYIPDFDEFRRRVLDKTALPHQVEMQPAPASGRGICWLQCPFCYGGQAKKSDERLTPQRWLEILDEIAAGGVRKVIFAGYCTDPLNSPCIDDLLAMAVDRGMVFGFNTRALRVSERFRQILSTPDIAAKSYLSVSVDAGSNEAYNVVHAVAQGSARLYDRVLGNVQAIADARRDLAHPFDISATYLLNEQNSADAEVLRFIANFRDAGCNLLRFAFPQLPRGRADLEGTVIPGRETCAALKARLAPLIEAQSTPACRTLIVDADDEHGIFRKDRTLPCVARFVYPTVGYDGWLYHCSQSSSPDFREMALGNLADRGFWDLFYDYDPERLGECFDASVRTMIAAHCRCDRKEHLLNGSVRDAGVFDEFLRPDSLWKE